MIAELNPKNLIEIRGWVGRNQQNFPTLIGQSHSGRTSDRCLAYATLTCEEKDASRILKVQHHFYSQQPLEPQQPPVAFATGSMRGLLVPLIHSVNACRDG